MDLHAGVLATFRSMSGPIKVKVLSVRPTDGYGPGVTVTAVSTGANRIYPRGDILTTHPAWVVQRNGQPFASTVLDHA